MKEIPGPLRNPDVSEDADREMDKAMDRMPAAAARRTIPEFAALDQPAASKKQSTAAEQRLSHAQVIKQNVEAAHDARLAEEQTSKEEEQADTIQLLRETNPGNITGSDHEAA
jgi:hypothetical protein